MSSVKMDRPSLITSLTMIQRLMWGVSAVFCIGTTWLFGFPERLGMLLGTLLMIGNVAFWHWLISRVLQSQSFSANGQSRSVAYKLIVLGHVKLVLVIGLLYFMVRYLPIHPMFLLVGLLVLPISAFLWAVSRTVVAFLRPNPASGVNRGGSFSDA